MSVERFDSCLIKHRVSLGWLVRAHAFRPVLGLIDGRPTVCMAGGLSDSYLPTLSESYRYSVVVGQIR